jgi:hypothetical protein
VAIAVASVRAVAQTPAPADEIAGRWTGTSICVKADWNASCKDERAVYFFERTDSGAKVILHGYKYVGATLESMGDLNCTYDPSAKSWIASFSNDRVRIRWSFQVLPRGLMTGRLVDLVQGQVARTVRVQRDSIQTPPPADTRR